MDNTYYYQICKVIMFIVCSSIVIYMTTKEIARFFANKDTSSVAIRKFEKPKDDQNNPYPTFSICFFQGLVMYRSNAFSKRGGPKKSSKVKIQNYKNILEGFEPYNPVTMARYPSFSSLTIKLKDLIIGYAIEDENFNRVNDWKYMNGTLVDLTNSPKNSNLPFAVSYQTTRSICFTWMNKLPNGINKMVDVLNFRKAALNNLVWNDKKNHTGRLYVYIHAQGQLLRNLDKPVITLNPRYDEFKGWHHVSVKRIDILKRRQDANIPCKSYSKNEDMDYLATVVSEVGCVPTYWRSLKFSKEGIPYCNSTEQHKKLHEEYNGYFPRPKRWGELKWVPCYEMVVSSAYNIKKFNNFRMIIQYRDLGSQYFETVNTRDFSFENLWSSIGGIVGIFLGFSIIYLFEMIGGCFKSLHTKFGKNETT